MEIYEKQNIWRSASFFVDFKRMSSSFDSVSSK